MDKKRILELELMLGRTPSGRYIGESVIEKIDALLKNSESKIESFTRCKLCDLQMDSDSFQSGCPNCGCKDIEDFENRTIVEE
jgi:Zn finger protein HypA/HybF involved in hydrogenase expression